MPNKWSYKTNMSIDQTRMYFLLHCALFTFGISHGNSYIKNVCATDIEISVGSKVLLIRKRSIVCKMNLYSFESIARFFCVFHSRGRVVARWRRGGGAAVACSEMTRFHWLSYDITGGIS